MVRRRVLPLLLAATLGLTLAGCGDDDDSTGGDPLSAVTVDGDPGKPPKVTFDGQVTTDDTVSEVLVEGDGEEPEAGAQVFAHVWIGNGFDQQEKLSTYDQGAPQLFTLDDAATSEPFLEALEGHPLGSRVLVAAPAADVFGEGGNPQLGIGNKDAVILVVDSISTVADKPQGQERPAPAWAPALVTDPDDPDVLTGLDFSDAPEPDGELRSATLIRGTGEKVTQGQTIYVNYLGQVYGAKEPFDESYSQPAPASFPIGVGQVIPGWDQTLVGVPTGSRVVLAIPPELGYGEEGNPQAGIGGKDTLYFVIDVLAATDPPTAPEESASPSGSGGSGSGSGR